MKEIIKLGNVSATLPTKAASERAKRRLVIELARELRYPTNAKKWDICRRAALKRAVTAEGGSIIE